MTNYLLVFASDWRGKALDCRFAALADGKPVSARDDTAPVYQLPDATSTVTITATPTVMPNVPLRWEKTVTLTIPASGPITAAADSAAYVQLKPPKSIGSDMQYTLVFIKLSRFQEATTRVVQLLDELPTTRSYSDDDGKTWYDVSVDADKERRIHKAMYGTWPPTNWNLGPVPDAHFLDVANPVNSGVLNFKKGALPTIDVDSVVLRIAGSSVPQYFAVTWPRTTTMTPTASSGPTPFFLFIRQSNRGNKYDQAGMFVGGDLKPYPDNSDYADEGMFASLHYAHDPLLMPWSEGVPYQAAMAGNNVVTVAPCNKFAEEFGILNQTEETRKILEEIQAFMFWRAGIPDPPNVVGKTAIAAFSSGTFHLNNWLRDTANLSGKFLSELVNAVYWLDPRNDFVDKFIEASLSWASYGAGDKRIRLYMRYPSASHTKLLHGTTYSAPYVRSTTVGDKRTAALITDADWARVRTKYLTAAALAKADSTWTYSHFAICSTMLTHALAQDFP